MGERFAREWQYYRAHRDELVGRYCDKLIAIEGDEVLGVVDSYEGELALHERGDVLITIVLRDSHIHTNGIYHDSATAAEIDKFAEAVLG